MYGFAKIFFNAFLKLIGLVVNTTGFKLTLCNTFGQFFLIYIQCNYARNAGPLLSRNSSNASA